MIQAVLYWGIGGLTNAKHEQKENGSKEGGRSKKDWNLKLYLAGLPFLSENKTLHNKLYLDELHENEFCLILISLVPLKENLVTIL